RMEVLTLAVISQLHARGNFHRIAREWFYGDPPETELGRQEAKFYAWAAACLLPPLVPRWAREVGLGPGDASTAGARRPSRASCSGSGRPKRRRYDHSNSVRRTGPGRGWWCRACRWGAR